jgi:hypothetical protein
LLYWPGMLAVPNSAPDEETPVNWNGCGSAQVSPRSVEVGDEDELEEVVVVPPPTVTVLVMVPVTVSVSVVATVTVAVETENRVVVEYDVFVCVW